MKLFICVILAIIAGTQALTDEQKANWKKWSEACQAEAGVTSETIIKARTGDYNPEDSKLQVHTLCFAKKAGLADDSGEPIIDSFKAKLKRVSDSDEEVDRMIEKCLVKKDTPGETLLRAYKCIIENKPKFTPV
ncbi:B1 protein [Asbolus verrucosus]|uniref:B1 protein n=1 Tax=Asbolus verrucosus TaxID=1661398 RepID=A0A482WDW2_ASBVE|nr:B1 protein [Asbolus verrucosus]